MIFLDEPTANLDYAATMQLQKLLLELKKQGKTLILSEHRLHYLSGIADELEFQFFTNSVLNELKYGHSVTPEFEAEAEQLLKMFGMWECRNRHPFSLSGGQMQKLSLMIAYFSPKQIVVLDEPTAGLDAKSLQSCAQLKELMLYMENNFRMGRDSPMQRTACRPCRLHLIVKLLSWLITLAAISTANNAFLFSVYAVLLLMIFVDGWYGMAVTGGGLTALLYGLNGLVSHTAVSFALMIFPRALAIWLSAHALVGRNEASRTIAALRAVHIPERLMLRVMRIAETLSASAETRGIALKGKRSSYVSLHYGAWDLLFFLLLIAAVVAGLPKGLTVSYIIN